jgi:hypothetical protein
MSSDRIPCLVPNCRRTAPKAKYPPRTQIICQKHWPLVPTRVRRLHAAIHRKAKRTGWTPALQRVASFHWQRIRRIAIEKAVGLA